MLNKEAQSTFFHAELQRISKKKLMLTNNSIEAIGVSSPIVQSNEIEYIQLDFTMNEENIKKAIIILENSPSIKNLKLRSEIKSPVEQKAFATLMDSLKKNSTLKKLDLSECKLTDAEGLLLADVLKVNTTLSELYLYRQKMTSVGPIAIINALLSNKTLQILDLSKFNHGVYIPLEEFTAFGAAMKNMILENTTLQKLTMLYVSDVFGSQAQIAAVKSDIADALENNDTLSHLEFDAGIVYGREETFEMTV